MHTYLLTHKATVGRSADNTTDIPPIYLTYYSLVKAASTEAAQEMSVQYSDPTFRTKITSIQRLETSLSLDVVEAMFAEDVVYQRDPH